MKTFFLFIIALFPSFLFAQGPILTKDNTSSLPEDSYHLIEANNPNFQFGDKGADKTWNFSSITMAHEGTLVEWKNVPSPPCQTEFEPATVCKQIYLSLAGVPWYMLAPQMFYYIINENYWQEIGSCITDSNGIILRSERYSNYKILFTYPFSFGSESTDNYSSIYNIGDSIRSRNGTYSIKGTGWGKLIIHEKTFENVVQVEIVDTFIDSSTSGNTSVVIREQRWYDGHNHIPLLVLSDNDGQKNTFISSVALGTDEINTSEQLMISPIPANDFLKIEFISGKVDIISLFNQQGIKVMTIHPEPSNVMIDVSSLPSGLYVLKTGTGTVRKIIID